MPTKIIIDKCELYPMRCNCRYL